MFASSLLGEGTGEESLAPRTSSPELTLPSTLAPSAFVTSSPVIGTEKIWLVSKAYYRECKESGKEGS